MFQHTATRKWPPKNLEKAIEGRKFQHTATRKWPQRIDPFKTHDKWVSTHSHPKVAACNKKDVVITIDVSTHSHPKVAAIFNNRTDFTQACFNTQPPESGR